MLAQREVSVLVDFGLLRRANLELKCPNRCHECSDGDEPDPLPASPYRSLLPLGAKAEASMPFIATGKQESAHRRGTAYLGSGLPVGDDDQPDDDAAVDDLKSLLGVREDANGAADDADSKRRQELDRRRMVVT